MEPVFEKKNRKLRTILEDKHSISNSREGDICFNGDRAFVKKVKDFFEDWESLNEVPERGVGR